MGGGFEVEFSEPSYAYRAGGNAHDALRAVPAAATAGSTEAGDCDRKGFFDPVDHDLLLARVAAKVRAKRVLRRIGRYLRAGVVRPDGTPEPTPPTATASANPETTRESDRNPGRLRRRL